MTWNMPAALNELQYQAGPLAVQAFYQTGQLEVLQ